MNQQRGQSYLMESYLVSLERQKQDIKHYQQLQKIKQQKISKSQPPQQNKHNVHTKNFDSQKYTILKKIDNSRVKNSKLNEINHENQRLLTNLIKIQKSKTVSKLSKEQCKPTFSQINHQNSIQQNYQKMLKIEQENIILSQRIMKQKSEFSINKLKKQEQDYLRLRGHLQKIKLPNVSTVRQRALSSHIGPNTQRKLPQRFQEEDNFNEEDQETKQRLQQLQEQILKKYQDDNAMKEIKQDIITESQKKPKKIKKIKAKNRSQSQNNNNLQQQQQDNNNSNKYSLKRDSEQGSSNNLQQNQQQQQNDLHSKILQAFSQSQQQKQLYEDQRKSSNKKKK